MFFSITYPLYQTRCCCVNYTHTHRRRVELRSLLEVSTFSRRVRRFLNETTKNKGYANQVNEWKIRDKSAAPSVDKNIRRNRVQVCPSDDDYFSTEMMLTSSDLFFDILKKKHFLLFFINSFSFSTWFSIISYVLHHKLSEFFFFFIFIFRWINKIIGMSRPFFSISIYIYIYRCLLFIIYRQYEL